MKIVFATNNQHKLYEIREAIGPRLQVIGLKDIGILEEIPEDQETIEGNSIQKAKYIFDKYQLVCIADDTGLEVEALNKRPGVFSARYAGVGCTFDDNINKLLDEMKGIKNRKARFRTVITFIESETKISTFEGIINGRILLARQGSDGFGYDPIFKPDGYNQSFAEMPLYKKNKISHRGRAVLKFCNYLSSQNFK
jgi:XTP/dITP diphosphohydrolase